MFVQNILNTSNIFCNISIKIVNILIMQCLIIIIIKKLNIKVMVGAYVRFKSKFIFFSLHKNLKHTPLKVLNNLDYLYTSLNKVKRLL